MVVDDSHQCFQVLTNHISHGADSGSSLESSQRMKYQARAALERMEKQKFQNHDKEFGI